MSASKKKHIDNDMDEEDESNKSGSGSSSDDEGTHPDAYTGNEQVEIDFEGRSPVDPDCHGIAQLLSRLFLKAHINCMQMADLIIAQNYVGSVISQCNDDADDDDDDMCEDGTIFGITTVLNLNAKKEVPCIEQLRTYLVERAEQHATDAVLTHFRHALGNKEHPIGFLINERFINIPPQISVPLLENLQKEIQSAKQKRMPFDFLYFLMIVKLYRKEAHKGKSAEDIYTNAEDEVISKHAVNSFEYAVTSECDVAMSGDWLEGDDTLIPYRKVLLIDAKQLPQLIFDIEKFISGQ